MSESFESPTSVSSESAPQQANSVEAPINSKVSLGSAGGETGLTSSLVVRGLAEFVGTFFVVFVLLGAASWTLIGSGGTVYSTALAAVVAYGVAALTFGKVSGGHFNPAVTLTAALVGKLKWIDALVYVIAQVVAGIAAAAILLPLIPLLPTSSSLTEKSWWGFMVNGFGQNSPIYLNSQVNISMQFAIVVELIGSLIVVSAVVSAMRDNGAPSKKFALTSAFAYGAATFITAPIDGASLNPARSTGAAIFAQIKGMSSSISQLWVFWVVPLLAGAIVGLVIVLTKTAQHSTPSLDQASPFGSAAASSDADYADADAVADEADLTEFNAVIETDEAEATDADAASDKGASASKKSSNGPLADEK
jgi:aquaporin Z